MARQVLALYMHRSPFTVVFLDTIWNLQAHFPEQTNHTHMQFVASVLFDMPCEYDVKDIGLDCSLSID
jgi:hypothetical protein